MNDPGRVLAELEELGTAQNRKIYARHGVGEPMFGVSFAHLRKLGKKLRHDHDLARALWASGNHDARVLALSVADPAQTDPGEIETWAGEVDNYVLIDEFAAFVAATPHFGACADTWTDHEGEWVASAGWSLVAQQALRDERTARRRTARRILRRAAAHHRGPHRRRRQPGATLHERSPHRHRRAQRSATRDCHRRGQAHRPGHRRPRRNLLQDPRGCPLHQPHLDPPQTRNRYRRLPSSPAVPTFSASCRNPQSSGPTCRDCRVIPRSSPSVNPASQTHHQPGTRTV